MATTEASSPINLSTLSEMESSTSIRSVATTPNTNIQASAPTIASSMATSEIVDETFATKTSRSSQDSLLRVSQPIASTFSIDHQDSVSFDISESSPASCQIAAINEAFATSQSLQTSLTSSPVASSTTIGLQCTTTESSPVSSQTHGITTKQAVSVQSASITSSPSENNRSSARNDANSPQDSSQAAKHMGNTQEASSSALSKQPSHYLLESKRWFNEFFSTLQRMYKTDQLMRLSDIDLVDRHGETLPAQRLLLAVFCPVITHLVLAKPEGIDDDVRRKLYFPEVTINEWKHILEFFYTGRIRASIEEVRMLRRSSSLLGIEELSLLCEAVTEQATLQKASSYIPKPKKRKNSASESTTSKEAQQNTKNDTDKNGANIYHEKAAETREEVAMEHSYSEAKEKAAYQCCRCNKTFEYGKQLFVHERLHNQNKLTADGRKKRLSPKIVLPEDTRVQFVNAAVNLACRYCDKLFTNESSKEYHERWHTRKKPHKCPDCLMSFHFPVNRDNHRIKEHGLTQDACPCPKCTKKFATEALLTRHITKVHTLKTSPPICPYCHEGIQFETLKEHKKKCPQKKFECDYCGKILSDERSFRGHINAHMNKRPHKCPFCHLGFSFQSSRSSHKRVCAKNPDNVRKRTGPAPSEKMGVEIVSEEKRTCPMCKEVVPVGSSLAVLTTHISNNHGTWQLQCETCQETCDTLKAFWKHTASHTQKPYVCETCGESFGHQFPLNLHMQKHKEPAYRCFICPTLSKSHEPNAVFHTLSNLFQHGVKVHNISFTGLHWLESVIYMSSNPTDYKLKRAGELVRYNDATDTLTINGTVVEPNNNILVRDADLDVGDATITDTSMITIGRNRQVQVTVVKKRRKKTFGVKDNQSVPKQRKVVVKRKADKEDKVLNTETSSEGTLIGGKPKPNRGKQTKIVKNAEETEVSTAVMNIAGEQKDPLVYFDNPGHFLPEDEEQQELGMFMDWRTVDDETMEQLGALDCAVVNIPTEGDEAGSVQVLQ